MPTWLIESMWSVHQRRKIAEAAVRAKFPNIIEGSSGWTRAVANRYRRTKCPTP